MKNAEILKFWNQFLSKFHQNNIYLNSGNSIVGNSIVGNSTVGRFTDGVLSVKNGAASDTDTKTTITRAVAAIARALWLTVFAILIISEIKQIFDYIAYTYLYPVIFSWFLDHRYQNVTLSLPFFAFNWTLTITIINIEHFCLRGILGFLQCIFANLHNLAFQKRFIIIVLYK